MHFQPTGPKSVSFGGRYQTRQTRWSAEHIYFFPDLGSVSAGVGGSEAGGRRVRGLGRRAGGAGRGSLV
jgi:hypothetical protein